MLKIWQTTDGKPADHSIHLGEIGVYIYRFIVGGYGRHIPSRPGLTLVDLGICLSFLRGLSTMLGGRSIGEINASNIIYIYTTIQNSHFLFQWRCEVHARLCSAVPMPAGWCHRGRSWLENCMKNISTLRWLFARVGAHICSFTSTETNQPNIHFRFLS